MRKFSLPLFLIKNVLEKDMHKETPLPRRIFLYFRKRLRLSIVFDGSLCFFCVVAHGQSGGGESGRISLPLILIKIFSRNDMQKKTPLPLVAFFKLFSLLRRDPYLAQPSMIRGFGHFPFSVFWM